MSLLSSKTLQGLSIVSTLADAGLAFARGRTIHGAVLLGAAALSTRVSGLGTAASVGLRAYRLVR
ncbi:MAG: hypothetical protein ABEJ31_03505 [Haloarculaceae archaeon]